MDWSLMTKLGPLGGIRALSAHFEAFGFTRHEHDHFVVGLVGEGLQTFELGAESYLTPPGHLILINPGEPHTGRAAAAGGFSYMAIYPEREDLARFQEGADLRSSGRLAFRHPLVLDESVHGRLWASGRGAGSDPMAQETRFVGAFRDLLRWHTTCEPTATGPRNPRRELRLALDYLQAHPASRITLGELAEVAELSPYHLARLFRQRFGLPPHKYLEGLRVRLAEKLIAAGQPLAEVALAAGFSSQSHLNRSFKRIRGVTPSAYLP